MYETATTTAMDNFYKAILLFYPKIYRQQFGEEMFYAFQDLYQEEINKHGKIGIGFLLAIFTDSIQSIFQEHLNMAKQIGLKKYFHLNNYNILGAIFLLPFALLFAYDLIGRIVQGDLNRYNRVYNAAISHSFLYANYFGKPLLLILVAIILPALAVLLNLIPLAKAIIQSKKLSLKFVLTNSIAILLTLFGLFCLLIIFGHDVVPCFIGGLLYHGGFNNLPQIISVCKNA